MMPSLELNIAGRPLKIQCTDENIDLVKGVASKISQLIDVEKKENVPFLTSTFIAFLKSMEENLNKEKILKDSLNKKLLYENTIDQLKEEVVNLKKIINSIDQKLDNELPIE